MKHRRQKLYIHKINDTGRKWLTEHSEIQAEAICYFSQQPNGDHVFEGEEILQHIPRLITMEDNEVLHTFPSLEEIHKVELEMSRNIAACPDGFNGRLLSNLLEYY